MISSDRLPMQREVYNFLRTVTVKYEPIAMQQNTALLSRGYSVSATDKTTWKYYLNMQGRYHESDTPMYVTSLDTRARILLTPEVLAGHPRTRTVYSPGGIYFKRLCETYPTQTDLIKSILFPVTDVEKAITSPDLTLLNYGTGYLEEMEEEPIVDAIVTFLAIQVERWHFKFLADEPLFHISFLSSLWTQLALVIMVEREVNVKTRYAHSWHIWNYLQTHGLDNYSDILDRKKTMMLYQNVEYFRANSGKQSNLEILHDRILSDFGIALYGRRVVLERQTGADNYQLTPQLKATYIPESSRFVSSEIVSETVGTIQEKAYEKGIAENPTSESVAVKERTLGDTTLNNYTTKFVEIRPITKNKVFASIINSFVIDTLMTSIIRGYYTTPISVTDTATGASLTLPPKELMAIYHYASMKAMGFTPTNIPNKFSLYTSFTTEIEPPKDVIWRGDEKVYVRSHFKPEEFLSGLNYDEDIYSPTEFSEMLERLWLRYLEHMWEDMTTSIDNRHYILAYLTSLCHKRRTETFSLVTNFTEYSRWFGIGGIDIESSVLSQYYLQEDPKASWQNLADTIISALIPMTDTLNYFGNFTMSDLGYDRLRKLFIEMCSYQLVFLESSRDTPEYSIGGKWSTQYGPDHIDAYSEITDVLYENHVNTITQTTPLEKHPGVELDIQSTTSSAMNYETQHDVSLLETGVSSHTDIAARFETAIDKTENLGSITLPGYTISFGSMFDSSPHSYIVDSDGARLIDSDKSRLTDSPTQS